MKLAFNAAIEAVDALLTPTMTAPAPVVASIDQNTTPAVFTRWVNFYDLCAAAVPNGFTTGGLPHRCRSSAGGTEEPLALRIGYAYEAAHDWHLRVPPMAAGVKQERHPPPPTSALALRPRSGVVSAHPPGSAARMTDRPILAATMGDPAGIGPEICVRALLSPEVRDASRSLVIGDARVLERALDAAA